MAVRTVLPRQVMSRGRPTLTESNRAITSSRATIPQFDRVSAGKSGASQSASLGVEWMITHLPIRALSSDPVDKFGVQGDIGDTTPSPVDRELERRFCRTDRRVLYDLAATPPSIPAL